MQNKKDLADSERVSSPLFCIFIKTNTNLLHFQYSYTINMFIFSKHVPFGYNKMKIHTIYFRNHKFKYRFFDDNGSSEFFKCYNYSCCK